MIKGNNQKILNDALKHQVYLERVKNGMSKEFKSTVIKKLSTSIKTLFETLSDQGIELKDVTRKKLTELLASVKEMQAKVMAEAVDELAGKLEEVAAYSSDYEVQALDKGTKADVKVKAISARKAYKKALREPLTSVEKEGVSLKKFIDGWTKNEIKVVSATIRNGFFSGATNQEIVQAIRGTKAKGYTDGLVSMVGRHAEALVRTSVQNVASTARAEVWENNSDILEGYRIVATLDGETTDICRGLDGQVFAVGEGPMPPFHINCRTTTVAVLKSEFAFLSEGATRSSLDGPVSAKQTYYDWLKDQGAGFQDDVLGPTRGALFRDGGLSTNEFAKLTLNQKFQPMTIDEMRTKMPSAFEKAGL